MDDDDIVVLTKRQKLPPPSTDGDLEVTVHIFSVNQQSTAFTTTKRHLSFVVTDCAKYLIKHNIEDATKNIHLPRIDASIIHEMVINHFGTLAADNDERY